METFLAYNPNIKIKPGTVVIPENLRPEFYKLFYTARAAFIKQRFAASVSDAITVNKSYKQVEGDITRQAGLEDITLPSFLQSFLGSPTQEFTKTLFDRLFNLLRGTIDIKSFEEQAARDIEPKLTDSIRLIYEKWATLSIAKLIGSDMFIIVIPQKRKVVGEEQDGDFTAPVYATYSPAPAILESRFVSFEHAQNPGLTVPDFYNPFNQDEWICRLQDRVQSSHDSRIRPQREARLVPS